MLGIAVLGPVRVAGEDGVLHPPASQRQSLLLAVLVANLGRVVDADVLVDALWGARLPEHPTAALQSQVFRLRRQLRAAAVTVDHVGAGYRLGAGRALLDATRFEDLVARAATTVEPAVAVRMLDDALGLWRGRAYAEVADHEAVQSEAVRLEELRGDVAERRAALLLELGEPTEAARAMETLMGEHPFREGPVRLRMRALAQAGRHVEAGQLYQRFRRRLAEGLGLEPSPELRDLEGEILRHETRGAPSIGLPGNSLIGREIDLSEISASLARRRLVTLTGPGGVGKSRLALHAATRVGPDYPDGVWLCELAAVGTPSAVAVSVASVLQLQPAGDPAAAVVRFLRTRRALLVLDNCEHVFDGARGLAAAVLSGAPEVDILATSRQRLGVDGEQVVRVAPLPLPARDDPDAPAVALLVDRATAVRPGFRLDPANLAAVCELCRQLDGLPLAIELAASRLVSCNPAELLAEVTERIDRLADPLRAAERHRSIEAVIAASDDSLDEASRHVFRVASVFAGGFTTAAASAVSDLDPTDSAAALSSLVERSLLNADDGAGGTTRFSMLEPVRRYAESLLAEGSDETRRRHAAWASAWIAAADTGLRTAAEAQWASAVAAEIPNLRRAHQWALDHDVHTALLISGHMFWYAVWYGAAEAFDWADAAVERAGDGAGPAVARSCATAALGAARHGDATRARALAERGITAADPDVADVRFAWEALSSTEMMSGNYERTLACQQQAFALAVRAGDTTHQARERAARAVAFGYLGQSDVASAELAAATELADVAGNPTVQAFCSYVAGELLLETDPTSALPLLTQAREVGRALGNRYLVAIAGVSAVSCAARIGLTHSLEDYAELLDHFDRTGSRVQQWTTIRTLIETLTRQRADEPAAILFGALSASRSAAPLVGADVARMERANDALEARLGDRYAQLVATGAALGDDAAITFARRCTTATSPPSELNSSA